MQIIEQDVSLLQITANAEKVIEYCGRLCYGSCDKMHDTSAGPFIRMLIDKGHESVLEHASATFIITTDRGITHELVRHRIASFSQESTRYCDYTKDRFGSSIALIEPPSLTAEQLSEWAGAVMHAERSYHNLRKMGVPAQIARAVLPTCTKATLAMTANFREWRHMLKLRLAPAAHPQMREVARAILASLMKHAPRVFSDVYGANGDTGAA